MLSFVQESHAQTDTPSNIRLEALSEKEPRLSAPTYSLLQDRLGLIWIGNQGGIFTYDGITLEDNPFGVADSIGLRREYIREMVETPDGSLWFGSAENGLFRFDPDAEALSAFGHDTTNPNSLSANRIDALTVDSRGILWIGSIGGELDRYNPSTNSFERFSFEQLRTAGADHGIHAIAEDQDGILWLGTKGAGLLQFDPVQESFTPIATVSADYNVLSLVFLDDETLLLGTEKHGVLRYEVSTDTITPLEGSNIGSSPEAVRVGSLARTDKTVWIATRETGIYEYDIEKQFSARLLLGSPDSAPAAYEVTSFLEDDSGVRWFGTMAGLFKMTQSPFSFLSSWPSPDTQVLPIYEDPKGILWMGTDGDGLLRYDPETKERKRYTTDAGTRSRIGGNRVFTIVPGRDGALWIGTFDGGLNRFDPETEEFTVYQNDPDDPKSIASTAVWSVANGGNGVLWVGTVDGGLNRFDVKTRDFNRYTTADGLSLNRISSIATEEDGSLWLGTPGGGLNRFDPQTRTNRVYRADPESADSLSGDRVLSLFLDSEKRLWIGTAGDGLNRYDRERDCFVRFSMEDGLVSNFVFSIREDQNGILWIATDRGLSRYHPGDRKFVNYTEIDDLGVTSFRIGNQGPRTSDYFHFGGLGGVVSVFPESITDNLLKPPILIRDFKLFDAPYDLPEPIHLTEEIVLPYNENAIDIHFASLDYTKPEKNEYQYILEGYDLEWINNGTTPTAKFRSLPTGNFLFRVRGSNSDGLWSDKEASLRIRILPPFYKRIWFLLLAGFLFIGLTYSAYRYRVMQLLELERMRLRIAADLHDELGANLSSISLFSEIISAEDIDPKTQREHAKTIWSTVQETIGALRETIWIIDPRRDRDGNVLRRMNMLAEHLLVNTKYTFTASPDDVIIIRDMQCRRHVLLAFKEILNNIVKHASATLVEIDIILQGSLLELVVSDNGVGFDVKYLQEAHGLHNLEMRAKRTQGSIKIESGPNQGTVIRFTANIA